MATNTLEENEDGFADNQIELRLSRDDGDENDDISTIEYQTAVPPLLSSTRLNNCTHTSPRLQQRRRQMEQTNRGQHLEVQPRQEPQRQGQTAAGEAEAEAEQDVIQPATSTTMSQKSLFVLRPVHRYVDLVCIGLSVLAYLLETTMNAALAIFGIGVGVGLVLGDSFRATLPLLPSVQASQQQQQHQHQQAQQSTVAPNRPVEEMASHELIDRRSVSNLLPAQ
eukprot:CAMPEP_0197179190 /NCGR_PEP_ID=MMETSP1423-20130617/4229_1 /TAXON_ID=476441 /ORGANISM="Pseudo-nitzschia heimii, Strain UNC1101" /LENGTH=223 /DNA_ID=CAMNT_0042629071 /DNA_START=201 /DNA_END=872 /DNA_ORIENTATION=+